MTCRCRRCTAHRGFSPPNDGWQNPMGMMVTSDIRVTVESVPVDPNTYLIPADNARWGIIFHEPLGTGYNIYMYSEYSPARRWTFNTLSYDHVRFNIEQFGPIVTGAWRVSASQMGTGVSIYELLRRR